MNNKMKTAACAVAANPETAVKIETAAALVAAELNAAGGVCGFAFEIGQAATVQSALIFSDIEIRLPWTCAGFDGRLCFVFERQGTAWKRAAGFCLSPLGMPLPAGLQQTLSNVAAAVLGVLDSAMHETLSPHE